MRNSEDIGEPDYQAINSRLIGKPVLSSYLNAREYTPKYEDDEVGQREEGYSGGTDYQALNSRLIGKPVLSSYLSGGRYIPKDEEDRTKYVFELIENSDYFRELMDFLTKRDKDDPNAPKMGAAVSAAFAGFYPEKIPEDQKELEKWKADWEDRKRAYLHYLDIPTRAYFFPDMTKEQVLSADEIPEIPEFLERLMRRPYFRAAASLLGNYLNDKGYVTFPDNKMVVSKMPFNKAAYKDFLANYYYPNVTNWSRQVKRELKEKMKSGGDRKEKLEEVKRELREKVNSEAAVTAKIAAANKEEEEIADEINSIIAKLEKKSIAYEDKTVEDLSQKFTSKERKSIPGNWANSTHTLNEFRNNVKVEGLDSPRGKAYTAIEEGMVHLLKTDLLTEILQDVDIEIARKFWSVVIGKGKPETFIKKLRYPLRGTRESVKYTADDVEQKLKLKEKIEMAAKAVKEKEMEKRQVTVKKIKDTRAKNKEAVKKEETTDGEKPATEKATTQNTKKGRAATKRVASSTTGTKSRSKVGSAALGAKTTTTKSTISKTKTPRKKVAKTPTKKGTRNKNPASTSDTLPVTVPPPTPKVRGKKSASPGNKKRVASGKKKSVPTSAALPPSPPPPAEESSSTAALPTEEGQGKKRAGTPPTAAPPRKRRTRKANPTARSYDLRERKV